ncbi:protein-L-isoaspartate O-methyltransferase [candidate division MSBL1 archaeon SCGC-AAA259E17]|uniref:Protein-L-isoaspartate O-methyltransferase n=1 Tax=candidate division MSBL1 archaeon SCGC-AAA259E17 TaxID=1698263 RepID=A0A133UE86_9EURY|nr:protein-L-isoaspartate O-methyltransferase [candidate division MSBL1 archaeon SCGC-AAA259E17]
MYEEDREEMVQSLKRRAYLKSPEVIRAFQNVPREEFVPSRMKEEAYADRPLPIGQGQTISAPSMIAIMLEALEVKKENKILEIGTGSGYNAALLAELAGEEGEVYTIERLESVSKTGRKNLERTGYDRVEVVVGDGTRGYQEEAPWDRILVTACAPEISEPFVNQTETGGRIAVPVGSHYMSQTLLIVEKTGENETEVQRHGGCAFVPLVGEHGWDEERTR